MSNTTHPPVPVTDAEVMTTHWRNYYADITGTDPENALRAFKIPLEDLQTLVDMAKGDAEITSVRAYLALGEAANGIIDPNEVHIILVPVSDTNSLAGTDILEVQKAGKMTSTIMDFTTPCPALCDFTSRLYGPQPKND